jgi:hypothetical protein
VLLQRGCDCGFARGGEAREPNREAFLLTEGVALGAREGRVPCDVACVVLAMVWWGRGVSIYVAMLIKVRWLGMEWERCDE